VADSLIQKQVDGNFADQRAFAGRPSDTAKYIWVGSFGLFYTALMADKSPLKDFYDANRTILLFAALAGAAAFLADALKSYWGFHFARELIEFLLAASEKRDADEASVIQRYNAKINASLVPRRSRFLLGLSLFCAALSAFLILVAFARQLRLFG
jgi:hypothetical protein